MEKVKILIIDDESVVRESLVGFLEDLNYSVFEASNGRLGLEKFKEILPNLVIVDLRMPEMDGIEFITEAVKIDKSIPIIVASGTGNIQDAVSAINAGAWDYLTKPITELNILIHRINNALLKAKLERDNENYNKYLENEIAKRTMEIHQKNLELEHSNKKLQEEIVAKDIATNQLQEALKDKEVLIKEIHHRVKNNLQIIASMLKLQIKNISDNQTSDIIKDILNRVKAMAFIHEKLYASNKMDTIAVNDYIDNIVKNLFISFGVDFEKIKLDFSYDILNVDLDTAVPCGLIVNEIVTNSLKYGFIGRERGVVTIKFRYDKEKKMVLLSLSDDGVGYTKADTENKKSLGLLLIEMLTKQLDGNLKVSHDNGVRYDISFKYSI